jgi:WD40 repeat protein
LITGSTGSPTVAPVFLQSTRDHAMPRCLCRLVVVWSVFVTGGSAQEPPAPPPATLELLLPTGAKATADGQAIDDPRTVPVTAFKPGEIRRVKVAVRFADGSSDERLVDVASGQHIRLAIPHPGPERAFVIGAHPLMPINSAAISRDGRHIALGLDAGTVVLWDTAAGRPIRTFAGHQKPVLSVAVTPDGKTLISGSADTTVVLWDIETGKPVRTCKGHTGAVVSIAVSPDGKRFLTGSPEGVAIHWKTDTGEQLHQLKWRNILAVAYSPDGQKLATSSADATATLWDATTGKQIVLLRGHREDVNCVTFSPDGKRVVTGSSDDSGAVWDATAGTRITRTRGHTVNVHSAAFTPDGRRVITGEREELVVMADAAIGSAVRTFVGHSAEILSILPRPDGQTMLTASRDGTARFWDLTTGRELLTLTTDGTGKAWAAVSPDGFFDGSDAGRRALGYRFLKGGFGEVDQYFAQGYRPGLLAEIWRGERPVPSKPLGRSKPPLVKLVAPKGRTSTDPTATLTADITDQGGGIGVVVVENHGVRLAVPTKTEPGAGGNATRVTFTLPLAPGANRIGVRASDRDGSRESAAAEIELSHPKTPGQRGRLYVVAVGVGEYAETGWSRPAPRKDAQALAAHLRDRAGNLFDRVDLVPVFDRDATRATIEDTIRDVAELSRPQDTLVVLLCGLGGIAGETVYFAPHDLRAGTDRPADALRKRGLCVDDIAAAIGTAPALHRALIVDVAASAGLFGDAPAGQSEFGLRGTVERWSRANGLHGLVAVGSTHPSLTRSLAEAGGDALDVADWFRVAAARAGSGVAVGTRRKGFPLLAGGK